MTLSELLERVEKCTEPDREMDNALWFALCAPSEWMGKVVERWHFDKATGWWNCTTADNWLHLEAKLAPDFTSSLDAALALVEEKLPGVVLSFLRYPNGAWGIGSCAGFGDEAPIITPDEFAKELLPPRVIAALLRALIAQQETAKT